MKLHSSFPWVAAFTLAALILNPSAARAEDPAPKTTPPATDKADKADKGDKEARRQRPPAGQQSEAARERRDAAMAELGLTDDQRDKVRAAQKEQADKMRAIRADDSLTQEQKTTKVRELRDSLNASVKTIMTADQYEKWQKMQDSRRNRSGRPNPGQPAPGSTPQPAK